jgi:hypothetical protein
MAPDNPEPPKLIIDERMDALTIGMDLHAAMMRYVDARLARLDERTTPQTGGQTRISGVFCRNSDLLMSPGDFTGTWNFW